MTKEKGIIAACIAAIAAIVVAVIYNPGIISKIFEDEDFVQHIHEGKEFIVEIEENELEEGCGVISNYLGNIIAGKSYTVKYIAKDHIWITEGPLQQNKNCDFYSSKQDKNTLIFDRANPKVNIWVAIFTLDDKGYLLDNGKRIGRIKKLLK